MSTVFAGIVFLSGCQDNTNEDHLVIFDQSLIKQAIELKKACEETENSLPSDQRASCELLKILNEYSKLPTTNAQDLDLKMGELLCEKIDLSSFRHSLRPRMNESTNEPLSKISNGKAIPSDSQCSWQNEDLNFVLNAQLGITNEQGSLKKVFVLLVDEQLQGSYRDYQMLSFNFDQGNLIINPEQ